MLTTSSKLWFIDERVSATKSLRILAVAAILTISFLTWNQLSSDREARIADTLHQMSRLDMVFAEQTGRAVEGVDLVLRTIADSADPDEAKLNRLIAGMAQVEGIALVDPSGGITLMSAHKLPANELPPDIRKLLLTSVARLRISPPFKTSDDHWTALMMRGLPNGGNVIAFLNFAYFEKFYEAVELNEDGAILLHLRDGTVLVRYPHRDTVIGTTYADLPPFKEILANNIAGTLIMKSPLDGSRRILAIRALKAFPLAVNISVSEKQVLASWWRQVIMFSAISGGAILAIIALMLVLEVHIFHMRQNRV